MAVHNNPDLAVRELAATYGDSTDLLQEILAIFLEEAPRRLEALRRAIPAHDFDGARRAAHSLANTAGTLRAGDALEAARTAEDAARVLNTAALAEAEVDLSDAIGRLIAAVEAFRALSVG